MNEHRQLDLVGFLASLVASSRISQTTGMEAIRVLAATEESSANVDDVLAGLESQDKAECRRVITEIRSNRLREAQRFHEQRKAGQADPECDRVLLGDLPLDAPIGWWRRKHQNQTLQKFAQLAEDYRFAKTMKALAPQTAQYVEERYRKAAADIPWPNEWHGVFPNEHLETLQADCQGQDETLFTLLESFKTEQTSSEELHPSVLEALVEQFQNGGTPTEKRTRLDRLCAYPKMEAAAAIAKLVTEPWAQERAELVMTCRFGKRLIGGWEAWRSWLQRCQGLLEEDLDAQFAVVRQHTAELLLFWLQQQENPQTQLIDALGTWCDRHASPVDAEAFVERWATGIPPAEWNSLLGIPIEVVPEKELVESLAIPKTIEGDAESDLSAEVVELVSVPETPPRGKQPVVRETAPPPPAGPSLWEAHLHPFFAENWYMVAGVVMAIAGSSLLAYYTWDKHWLVRYSLMPLLLAGFTMLLARLGTWIESRDQKFAGTAAILRGAAIGLFPINFLVVVLLSQDGLVGTRGLVVPLMALSYLGIFGWRLSRWCRDVHSSLTWVLGGPLLMVAGLVMLGPIAKNLAQVEGPTLRTIVAGGFYLGFLTLATATVYFLNRVLTKEMADEKRVPWFFGATLVITFVQTFLWVYGYLQLVPHIATYAPLVILAGGLVLLGERRGLDFSKSSQHYLDESFVGYALVLLGTVMGATDPVLRIFAFALGGIVWLRQASLRRDLLHHYIGLTFFLAAVASFGFLESFPKEWMAMLGVAATVLMVGIGIIAKKAGLDQLSRATRGMESTTLLLTAITAMLAQWHFQTEPLTTGMGLFAVAAGFGFLAWRDDELHSVHIAAMLLALALPYLGCVDMLGKTLRGNTMVFGLAVLSFAWLLLNWVVSAPLIRNARSTVLWFYGGLSVVAMCMRIFAEPLVTQNLMGTQAAMDYFGPLMMTVAMVFAAWYSRSLIPAAMAGVIAIILFPELKAQFQTTFTYFGFGSGLGSASSGLGLMVSCFVLRKVPALQSFGEGDRFLGRVPFPFRRFDFTLFTWPLLVCVFFLTIRTETWTLAGHILAGEVSLKTALALGVTAITWPLIAVYYRNSPQAPVASVVGCFALIAAVLFAQPHVAENTHWTEGLLVAGLILQGLYFLYHFGFRKTDWARAILENPTVWILESVTVFLAVVEIGQLMAGHDGFSLAVRGFVVAQLVWHSLRKPMSRVPSTERLLRWKESLDACLLFVWIGVLILAESTTGTGPLLLHLSLADSLSGILGLLLGVQVVHLILEFQPSWRSRLNPLAETFLFLSSLVLVGLVLGATVDQLGLATLSSGFILLLFGVALLTARAQASSLLLLLALLYLYGVSPQLLHSSEMLDDLSDPLRLSLFSGLLAVVGIVGQRIASQRPQLIAGPFSQLFFRFPQVDWLFGPALGLSAATVVLQTALPEYRDSSSYLLIPFLAAATWGFVCWHWPLPLGTVAAVVWVSIGNVHTVRVLGGDFLRERGLSEIHLICLGLAATLIQLTLFRAIAKREKITAFVHQAGLVLAGLILSLLAINYLGHPNLADIPWLRFAISGAMAYLAGLYFRGAARHTAPGEESYVELSEALYHFAVTTSMWCLALIVPWLRQPAVALYAVGIPFFYFYVRAEMGFRSGQEFARRYRNTAAVLGFAGLACYVFRPFVQLVFFPDEPFLNTGYYHNNAPFIVVLSLVLLRLHALGGTGWLAVYAGLGLMTGSYFVLTWLPDLSPFEHPVAGAWCAIALGHFWILVTQQRSPLRTIFQRLGAIGGQHWLTLRRGWGFCLLAAVQFLVVCGLFDWQAHPYAMAPLLVGAASVLIHLGIVRGSALYIGLAGLQLIVAIHADFFVPSYLPKDAVVWALLAIWAASLVVDLIRPKLVLAFNLAHWVIGLSMLVLGHILYHHPTSVVGLWAFGIGSLLAAFTPRNHARPQTVEQKLAAGLLLWTPIWLVFFSQVDRDGAWPSAAFAVWPLLVTLATAFAISVFARISQTFWAAHYDRQHRERFRLFDQTFSWIAESGQGIHSLSLWSTFTLAVLVHLTHFADRLPSAELTLMVGLYALLAVAWFYEGRLRNAMAPYICLELSVLGLLLAVRVQILQPMDFWKIEYDVWASLLASCILTSVKPLIDKQPRQIRYPFLSLLLGLPLFSGAWVLAHHMGTDMVLLVIGLQSLLFAFLGKDDRESPYHVVSVMGFVAFLVIVFWDRLELRYLHAYTIPVGLGILVLLQLFKNRIPVDVRNRVRLVTLLVMVSSSAYYALIDTQHPIGFHLTLIILCLASMALGSFFRIRLYLLIGFCGLLTDVASIVYRVMVQMERSSRMTMVGSIVLLIGLGLVFGTLYYKTHEESMNRHLDRWRKTLGGWE